MVKSLGEISQIINARVQGDDSIRIEDAKTTLRATSRDITFAISEEHLELFLQSECLAALVPDSLDIAKFDTHGKSFLMVEKVEDCFAKTVSIFRPPIQRNRIGISQAAFIAASAQIAEDVDIYPGAYVGENVRIGCGTVIHPNVTVMDGSTIGANSTLFPSVTIYECTTIGDRCILHGGAVIGAYGFGYKSSQTHELSAQLGNVVIGNDVEIGSNTTIDRGTYDSTTIGDGTKIDDLVMIGHNCQIGKHNLLCSQVGIAGSTTTGDYVVMAGQVGIGDHLHIGDKSVLGAQSGVMHNLPGNQTYLGSPAIPSRQQMQIFGIINKLPDIRKQLRALQKLVDAHFSATKSKNEAA